MTEAHVVAALVNSVWQSALVVAVALLALRIFRRIGAAARCAVWQAVLLVAAALPLVDLVTSLAPHAPPAQAYRIAFARAHAVSSAAAFRATIVSVPPSAADLWIERAAVALGGAAPWLERFWLAVAALLLLRLGCDTVRLLLAKRSLRPLRRSVPQQPGARAYRLGTSSRIETPCVLGLYDPVIVLPEALAAALSDDDLARVISHEAAHVQRRDDWINLCERTLRALLFFNPLVYAAGRGLAVEREIACDDRAVASSGDRIAYASCLSNLAAYLSSSRRAAHYPAFFSGRRQLVVRVERLLEGAHDGGAPFSARALLAFASVAAVAIVVPHFGIPVRAQIAKVAAPPVQHRAIARPARRTVPHLGSPRPHVRASRAGGWVAAARAIAPPRSAAAPHRHPAARPAARAATPAFAAAPVVAPPAPPDAMQIVPAVSYAPMARAAEAEAYAASSARYAYAAAGDAVESDQHVPAPPDLRMMPASLHVGLPCRCRFRTLEGIDVTLRTVARIQVKLGRRYVDIERIVRTSGAGV